MRFDAKGIQVTTAELGAILEGKGYPDDDAFIERAVDIARRAINGEVGQLRDVLEQGDDRFSFSKGLLERLDTLDQASRDELSRMLHILHPDQISSEGSAPLSEFFSYEHTDAFIAYIQQRIEDLLMTQQQAEDDMNTYPGDSRDYYMAEQNYEIAEKEIKKYRYYLSRFEYQLKSVDVPDAD